MSTKIIETVDRIIVSDTMAVSATPTPMPDIKVTHGVLILNPTGSGGTIYIGASDVTVSSFPLSAGQTIFIPISKLSNVVILASGSFNINYLGY